MAKLPLLLINCYTTDERDEKIKSYSSILHTVAAERGMDLDIAIVTPDAALPQPDAGVVIVSGSHRMIGDNDFPQALYDFMRACRSPLLGICYGHQMLARAYDCHVTKDAYAHKGPETIHQLLADPLLEGLGETFAMEESHEEVVLADDALARSFTLIAVNGERGVEVIRHKQMPFWGVQFHPERSGEKGACVLGHFLALHKKS
jgi:GMP synthase (glutamine-hydrolysing)